MIAARCFCGEGWNVPAKECAGGHPMTPAEAEVWRLRTEIQEMIDDWEEQATADENGWSFRRGNNVFNEGAAFVLRYGVKELKGLLSEGHTDG